MFSAGFRGVGSWQTKEKSWLFSTIISIYIYIGRHFLFIWCSCCFSVDLQSDVLFKIYKTSEEWRCRVVEGAFPLLGEAPTLIEAPWLFLDLQWDLAQVPLKCHGYSLFHHNYFDMKP